MKLYEVNQTIEALVEQMVDIETGEILPVSDELIILTLESHHSNPSEPPLILLLRSHTKY